MLLNPGCCASSGDEGSWRSGLVIVSRLRLRKTSASLPDLRQNRIHVDNVQSSSDLDPLRMEGAGQRLFVWKICRRAARGARVMVHTHNRPRSGTSRRRARQCPRQHHCSISPSLPQKNQTEYKKYIDSAYDATVETGSLLHPGEPNREESGGHG